MTKRNKSFDCVDMKHKGAAFLRKKLSKLSEKQKLEYWNKCFQKMCDQQNFARKSKSRKSKTFKPLPSAQGKIA